MTDLFQDGMAFVWRPENDGTGLHTSPKDPGGATSWGATFTTWSAWQRMNNSAVSVEAFVAMAPGGFLTMFRSLFWNSCRCGNLGAIGIMVFDAAMNCGQGHAAGFLQTVLRQGNPMLIVDDQIGPVTVAAALNTDPRVLAVKLCTEREAFYATRPTAIYFERGWDRRAEDCRDYALSLMPGV